MCECVCLVLPIQPLLFAVFLESLSDWRVKAFPLLCENFFFAFVLGASAPSRQYTVTDDVTFISTNAKRENEREKNFARIIDGIIHGLKGLHIFLFFFFLLCYGFCEYFNAENLTLQARATLLRNTTRCSTCSFDETWFFSFFFFFKRPKVFRNFPFTIYGSKRVSR